MKLSIFLVFVLNTFLSQALAISDFELAKHEYAWHLRLQAIGCPAGIKGAAHYRESVALKKQYGENWYADVDHTQYKFPKTNWETLRKYPNSACGGDQYIKYINDNPYNDGRW